MKKLIVTNWKMNPITLQEALALAKVSDYEGVVLCVPFPYLIPLQQILHHAKLGAQDVASYTQGPYTGDVSASMLKDVGCEYVIIGHSERRRRYHEDKALVHAKLVTAKAAGLLSILCVTSPEEARYPPAPFLVYEPEDAISTNAGVVPSLEHIESVTHRMHSITPQAMILYGGNVNAANAKDILGMKSVDGVLVGAASLKPDEFQKIVHYAPLQVQ